MESSTTCLASAPSELAERAAAELSGHGVASETLLAELDAADR